MSTILEASFWLAALVLVYTYGGFSIVVFMLGKMLNRGVGKGEITPEVSIIIAAYNEEGGIARKLDNVLSLDYPKDKLEIIVASDGSDDATRDIVSRYKTAGVIFLDLPRRGKIFALDDAVARSSGEILIFSDANTLFDTQAIKMLVRNFADARVGGVCGNQQHVDIATGDNSSKGEELYWLYDKWLKEHESLTGSIVSADGAIYAIRGELYRLPPKTDVTDDFAISTGVVAQGFRLVFESEALAHETASAKAANEFSRKVRIMNRGLRGVMMRKALLNPFNTGVYALILFSHKVLRRLVPFVLLYILGVGLLLASGSTFFKLAAGAQIAFYSLALLGYFLRENPFGRSKVLYVPFFYCLANAAALVAITRLMRGKRIELWQPHRERFEGQELVKSEII